MSPTVLETRQKNIKSVYTITTVRRTSFCYANRINIELTEKEKFCIRTNNLFSTNFAAKHKFKSIEFKSIFFS